MIAVFPFNRSRAEFFSLAHDLLTDCMPQSYFHFGAEFYNVHSRMLDCQFDTVHVERTWAAKPPSLAILT